jgi:hypothetical protein
MSDAAVFVFSPEQAVDTTGASGMQVTIDTYINAKTVESCELEVVRGNVIVLVVTT